MQPEMFFYTKHLITRRLYGTDCVYCSVKQIREKKKQMKNLGPRSAISSEYGFEGIFTIVTKSFGPRMGIINGDLSIETLDNWFTRTKTPFESEANNNSAALFL